MILNVFDILFNLNQKYQSLLLCSEAAVRRYFSKEIFLKTPVFESVKACNFIKKRLQRKCFPVNIAKFLRTAFLQNTFGDCFFMPRTTLRHPC